MQQEGNWWYVVVQPDKEDVRSSQYAASLEAIEDEIETSDKVKVLLVPILPG